MANKDIRKLYVEANGVDERRDFKIWYEDGFDFCDVHSLNNWLLETDRVHLVGPLGGLVGSIKPDHRALTYDVGVDRWTYTLKTMTIFKHYFFEGMMWKMYGGLRDGKACFYNQDTRKKDVYVYYLEDWKNRGPVYEIRVRDISKLRPAAAAIVAIMIKESYVGLSIGEGDPNLGRIQKLIRSVRDTGYTYEEIQKLEAEGRNVIEMPEKMTSAEAAELRRKHKK